METIDLGTLTVTRPNENGDEVYYKDDDLVAIWASGRGLETVQPLNQDELKEIVDYRFNDE